MDIQAEKIQLAKRLLETENEIILQQVKDIFEGMNWETIPDHVKAGITRAQKQASNGLLTSHKEVTETHKKYL